ncbi:MAG TPA: flagellar export chaperone FliS [Spirochaetota bacterium]|nr:flagellar export chaperone FliS [Spirochaetota bacterium]OPZ38266.1 MAG: Flagellar protein FliS [Spirochaetes bacterium ADurb.BinA120]HNU92177.1 flagellar export chaperone FliS [Spirochaetota bacterium]HPI14226.1 flagellar export chaperone FliS [Spirochaetota bacterium]HPO44721.1 flagellar export chaperone FliS [Spirochaetota bacterium]
MALPQKNPYDQYKRTEINTANQGKLIVMLYDGAIKFLNIAIENMEPRTYDIVNTNIIKAQDIITELLLSLNVGEGGEISRSLMSLYLYFKKRLLEANVQKDAGLVKEVLVHLQELRAAWDKISAKEARTDAQSGLHNKGSFSIEG